VCVELYGWHCSVRACGIGGGWITADRSVVTGAPCKRACHVCGDRCVHKLPAATGPGGRPHQCALSLCLSVSVSLSIPLYHSIPPLSLLLSR
jgi:hypothetical protein